MSQEINNKWEIKLKSGNTFTTTEYKNKRSAVKAFPSRMTSIQRFWRTYYITPYEGK